MQANMQIETPPALTLSINQAVAHGGQASKKPSTSSSPRSPTTAKVSCPFLASSSSSSSAPASPRVCTAGTPAVASSSSSSSSSSPHAHTCPFAAAIPSSREPVYHTLADGTVIETRRRCPRWVRVLRFSAKFIAKQVVIRTAKSVVMNLIKTISHANNNDNNNNNSTFNSHDESPSSSSSSISLPNNKQD